MPREIKTTLAVDGEQAFKRAINEANTSMRNLGTQLTLAQAQFKKDGDAMKLMETRSKALKGEIGQQEEIVKALEKAVTDSTKAYGENSEKTEKWQAELNRAKAKLVSLQSELALNDVGLDRNGKSFEESTSKAADYQATLETIGRGVSFEAVTKGIGGITSAVEGAIKKVLNLAGTIREAFADAGEWADQLGEDADRYGLDVETLQRWQNAADFIDTDVETIMKARDKITAKMADGWKDGEIDMWEFLGIDIHDADGRYRDQMEILFEIGDKLMMMETVDGNTVRADKYAMEALGKSYKDLKPLFMAGREEWEKTVAEQQVVSKERVKALQELDDANKMLENSWDVTKYSFLADLAPVITDITMAVADMLKQFNEWMDTEEGKQAMKDLSDAIRELFSGLTNIKFSDVIDKVKNALDGIVSVFKWLDEHKGDVVKALEIIAGGFAMLKLGGIVTNLLSLKNGLGGLTGGKTVTPVVQNGGANAAVAGGATAGGGLFAKMGAGIKGFASALSAGWATAGGIYSLAPLGVFAAGVLPAGIMQVNEDKARIKKYEATKEYAQEAKEAGKNEGDIDLLLKLNRAVGPKENGKGGYKRSLTGLFLDMSPDDQVDYLLQELGDVRNRGSIYADVKKYGPMMEKQYIEGWRPESMLMRSWGVPVEDAFGNAAGALSTEETYALAMWLRELMILKLQDQQGKKNDTVEGVTSDTLRTIGNGVNKVGEVMSEMFLNSAPGVRKWLRGGTDDAVTVSDMRFFRDLPAEMQEKVMIGVERGVSQIKVVIDGYNAGKLLAPHIDRELAKNAQ